MLFKNPLHKALKHIVSVLHGRSIIHCLRWAIDHVRKIICLCLEIDWEMSQRNSLCCFLWQRWSFLLLNMLLVSFLKLYKLIMVLHLNADIVGGIDLRCIRVYVRILFVVGTVNLIVALTWVTIDRIVDACRKRGVRPWTIDFFACFHMCLYAILWVKLLTTRGASWYFSTSAPIVNSSVRKTFILMFFSQMCLE